mmetsp:Transcript_38653/g.39006  ORF Transcript_38653/g.39006 Transcript_38653/m.39006 type:complete len:158 (-) Transcript_38653:192-665(-)
MDTINIGISVLNRSIDTGTAYVKNNLYPIAILLVAVYYFRTRYPKGSMHQGYVLSSSSSSVSQDEKNSYSTNITNGITITDHQEEIRKVRQRQQEIATDRATDAAKKRKEKEREEREQKRVIARKNHDQGGNRLGRNPSKTTTTTTTITSSSNPYPS